MKRNILNIILSTILILALLAGSLLIPRILPGYKNETTAHEPIETERFQYINATDTLDIYPWDKYDPENCAEVPQPIIDRSAYSMGELLLMYIANLFPDFYPEDGDSFITNLYADSDKSTMFYVKDYSYINGENKKCTVSAAYEYSILVYICCSYDDQQELTSDEISRASISLTNTLMNINGWHYKEGTAYVFTEEDIAISSDNSGMMNEGSASYSSYIDDANPINCFFASFLFTLAYPPGEDYEPRWEEIEMGLVDYSVIYYDHYFIINIDTSNYFGDDSALYIFYDPTVECVIGYSFQSSVY